MTSSSPLLFSFIRRWCPAAENRDNELSQRRRGSGAAVSVKTWPLHALWATGHHSTFYYKSAAAAAASSNKGPAAAGPRDCQLTAGRRRGTLDYLLLSPSFARAINIVIRRPSRPFCLSLPVSVSRAQSASSCVFQGITGQLNCFFVHCKFQLIKRVLS